ARSGTAAGCRSGCRWRPVRAARGRARPEACRDTRRRRSGISGRRAGAPAPPGRRLARPDPEMPSASPAVEPHGAPLPGRGGDRLEDVEAAPRVRGGCVGPTRRAVGHHGVRDQTVGGGVERGVEHRAGQPVADQSHTQGADEARAHGPTIGAPGFCGSLPLLATSVWPYHLADPCTFATIWWLARRGVVNSWRLHLPVLF